MPTVDELRFLAHVRLGNASEGELRKGEAAEDTRSDEFAVIIANRLP